MYFTCKKFPWDTFNILDVIVVLIACGCDIDKDVHEFLEVLIRRQIRQVLISKRVYKLIWHPGSFNIATEKFPTLQMRHLFLSKYCHCQVQSDNMLLKVVVTVITVHSDLCILRSGSSIPKLGNVLDHEVILL